MFYDVCVHVLYMSLVYAHRCVGNLCLVVITHVVVCVTRGHVVTVQRMAYVAAHVGRQVSFC